MSDALRSIRAYQLLAQLRQSAEPCEPCGDDDTDATVLEPGSTLAMQGPVSAAAAVVAWPAEHFEKWDTSGKEYTPLQVTSDGRVFGHVAGGGCYRDGSNACLRYQRDPDPELKNFHTHTTTLDNGEVIRTGAITAGSNHADTSMSLAEARAFHENTGTIFARVIAWEDKRGRLAVAGSVVPGLDDRTIGQVAGAPVSIEIWPTRETNGIPTLTAMQAVISPAWPVLT